MEPLNNSNLSEYPIQEQQHKPTQYHINNLPLILLIIVLFFVAGLEGAYILGTREKNTQITQIVTPTEIPSIIPTSMVNPTTSTDQKISSTMDKNIGIITGKLCYPSDHVPSGIVTAKNIDTGEMYSVSYTWDGKSQDNPVYRIETKPGKYHVKYDSKPDPGDSTGPGTAYYTSNANCVFSGKACPNESNPLSIATVIVGKTTTNVHLCDENVTPKPLDF